MNLQTIIPDRYNDKSRNDKYKYINVYEIYQHYVKLLIVDRLSKKTELTILLERDDFEKVSEHHWGGTRGLRPPCIKVGKKSFTIGQYISGSNFRICGKIKGQSLWDLRQNQYSATGNIYSSVDKGRMKLDIYRRNSAPYSVIFDKEDYSLISKHIWRVEKDSKGTYSVISRDNNKQLSMHSYLLKSHGQSPGTRGFRGIEYKDSQFDFRKSILYKKHALNIYSIINSTTIELAINSVHGIVKIIFDRKDYKRVSSISWIYKRNGPTWVVCNYKHGQLKRFILGSIEQKFRYIIEKKDKLSRLDYRRKTLLDCMR
jgi:hypothetical protein